MQAYDSKLAARTATPSQQPPRHPPPGSQKAVNDKKSKFILSDDVGNLLGHYRQGPDRYHEIGLQQAIEAIRARWPLLREIAQAEAPAGD